MSAENLTRHNIMLFPGQIERLNYHYTFRSASEVIRTLVAKHLDDLDRLEAERNALKEKEGV